MLESKLTADVWTIEKGGVHWGCSTWETLPNRTNEDVFNTLRTRQNGRHFADDTFERIFLNENVEISIKISLKFGPKGPTYDIPTLVQVMAWRRSGDKPLSEPMVVSLLTHICVTRPQWVNGLPAICVSILCFWITVNAFWMEYLNWCIDNLYITLWIVGITDKDFTH